MTFSKILAIKLRAMGDTILVTGPLIELTRAYPQAEIDVVVAEPWAPLLEGIPGIHRIWAFPQSTGKLFRLRNLTRIAMTLRKERYDCVINFHASPSSARLSFATG